LNTLLSDNRVGSVQEHLLTQLSALYEQREAANIVSELFRHYKGWGRADLLMHKQDRMTESEILQFHFAGKRLSKGEPLQYILGKAWFHGLEFNVSPAVLIPRPETEELVELIVADFKNQKPSIVDIGTGSGCIPIALKKAMPDTQVSAIDVSADALAIAKQNATLNEVDIAFLQKDILQEDLGELKVDVIVSNPPYIPLGEKTSMRRQVTDHEPGLALFVPDEEPLLFYERIVELSKQSLQPNGRVYFEIHEDMEEELTQLLEQHGITTFQFVKDMQGKVRMLWYQL
jgi:release factor glutamine methyltransferase